jgi:hypothetical protein
VAGGAAQGGVGHVTNLGAVSPTIKAGRQAHQSGHDAWRSARPRDRFWNRGDDLKTLRFSPGVAGMTMIDVGELLYEYTLTITGLKEYGFSFASLMAGEAPPPPEGARFDVVFDGVASGSKLKGKVTGVDYLRVRADGRFQLHIHAEIITDDDQRISLEADGVALPRPDSSIADLRENVTLFTSSRDYAWVNPLQVWGIGTVDLAAQVIHVKGYSA